MKKYLFALTFFWATLLRGAVAIPPSDINPIPAYSLLGRSSGTQGAGQTISVGVNGVAFLATPSSANLATWVTGETGTGALVFGTSPTLVTPALGTPTGIVLTSGTGLPVSTGVAGLGTGVANALAINTGSAGAFVVFNGALGTPASGNLTNATAFPKADVLEASLFAADAGASDAYAITLSPAISAYVTGAHYWFKANTANTGAATININGLGAKTVVKVTGGITTTLADNDIRAGQWVDLAYDGTNMQMQSTLGNVGVSAGGSDTQVQFNDGGTALGGNAGYTYNKTTNQIATTGTVITTANAMGALAIDTTKGLNTKTVSTDSTFTFSATPATNTWFSLYCINSDTASHVLTIPSSFSVNRGAAITTMTINASADVYLTWRYDGSTYKLFGDPAQTNDLSQNTAPASNADFIPIYQASTGLDRKVLVGDIQPTNLTVYASGTAYSFTNSDAAIDFGTTDPNLTINKTGTYLIFGRVYCKYTGATFAANQTITLKIRRTNNTAADVANSTTTQTLRIITTLTDSIGVMPLPPIIYTTTNSNDALALYGSLSAAPAAGSVDATEASIVAIRLTNP